MEKEIIKYKICTKCNKPKPLEAFSKVKGGKHGRASRCKACVSAYSKWYYGRALSKNPKKKKGFAIHDLSDRRSYPLVHKYVSGRGISIYTHNAIGLYDVVLLNGVAYELGTTPELTGRKHVANLRGVDMFHYDFILKPIKKSK